MVDKYSVARKSAEIIDILLSYPTIESKVLFHKLLIRLSKQRIHVTDELSRNWSHVSKLFWNNEAETYRKSLVEISIRRDNSIDEFVVVLSVLESALSFYKKHMYDLEKIVIDGALLSCEKAQYPTFSNTNTSFVGGASLQSQTGSGHAVLGGWFPRVKDSAERREFVGLTCRHLFDLSTKGDKLVKTKVYSTSRDRIGTIESVIDLTPSNYGQSPNYVDLAFIRPCKTIATNEVFCTQPHISGDSDGTKNFEKGNPKVLVCCNGCCEVREIIGLVRKMFVEHNGVQYEFKDLLKINLVKQGESGSLLTDMDEQVCGLVFASRQPSSTEGYAMQWRNIKKYATIPFLIN